MEEVIRFDFLAMTGRFILIWGRDLGSSEYYLCAHSQALGSLLARDVQGHVSQGQPRRAAY
jgi:hypothetical protein